MSEAAFRFSDGKPHFSSLWAYCIILVIYPGSTSFRLRILPLIKIRRKKLALLKEKKNNCVTRCRFVPIPRLCHDRVILSTRCLLKMAGVKFCVFRRNENNNVFHVSLLFLSARLQKCYYANSIILTSNNFVCSPLSSWRIQSKRRQETSFLLFDVNMHGDAS
jgi:hypothetical protein